ncbi:hypothetical protein GALL_03560 [mine drainage metagenome]|uniref:DUF4124 domain-containing protein n=1 Tax=mine drainage metagenome TaxID=410659 RepID=A0A1J5TH48_9ZZZZ
MKVSLLLVVLLSISPLASAGVFKCATPAGLVYSEQPCAKNARELDFHPVKPVETVAPPDKTMQQMEQESAAQKKQRAAMEKNAADNAAAARQSRCAAARQRLDIYQRQVRVYNQNEKGERTYVDDDTRAAIIENARKEAESNCDS